MTSEPGISNFPGVLLHIWALVLWTIPTFANQIKPRLRLVCAVGYMNDGPTGRWNQNRIPGILVPGILMRATAKAARRWIRPGGQR
jgi:hypothetical protein